MKGIGEPYIANDGSLFQQPNFKALCSPTRTTKTVNEAIGNKGVGFLSTFQVCNFPEIYSRSVASSDVFDGYSFRFGDPDDVCALLASRGQADDIKIVVDQMPRLYLACPIAQEADRLHKLAAEGFATVVRLVLKNGEAMAAVASQLEKLVSGDAPVHLFLTRLRELTIKIGEKITTLNRTVQILADSDGFRLQEVECAGRTYIMAQRLISHNDVLSAIQHDVDAQALPESWMHWKGDATVSLAVVKDGPPLAGRMYNFLPMGIGAVSPFAGHFDAPFFATIERLNVQSGVKLNELFLTTARRLAVEAARTCRDLLKPSSSMKAVAETFLDGVLRELREETSLHANPNNCRLLHVQQVVTEKGEWLALYFSIGSFDGVPEIVEPEKHDRVEWRDLSDQSEPIVPYVKAALQEIGNKSALSIFRM